MGLYSIIYGFNSFLKTERKLNANVAIFTEKFPKLIIPMTPPHSWINNVFCQQTAPEISVWFPWTKAVLGRVMSFAGVC